MTTQQRTSDDILGMSDEELLKAGPPPAAPVESQPTGSENQEQSNEGNENQDAGDEDDDNAGDDAGKENKEEDKSGKDADDDGSKEEDAGDDSKKEDKSQDPPKKDASTETSTDPAKKKEADPPKTEAKPDQSQALTADQQLAKILAPFKANGRDMKVENVDEAIALMQMGANYNKKMAGLKPSLKILKFLENNQLLDEEKLSFLVDVHKKDPAAINKLIKDSGIDVMELDASKADSYKRTTASVDDREIELDTVLKDLEDSPTYAKTLNVVTKEWDSNSKEQIASRPQLLKIIDNHVQTGIYDLVSTELQRQRALGKLDGVSDIEAYRRIGDAMHAEGRFNHLETQSSQEKPQPKAPVVVPAKPKKQDDEALNNKRRALSPSKAAVPAKVPDDFNPLGLSDAEFMKRANAKYQ